jgi:two-component system, response regulator PdtaR
MSPAFPSDCTVLVAEDDPVMALDLDDRLRRFGCTVLGPVATAAEGLRLVHRQRPSLALLRASAWEGGFLLLANVLASIHVPFGVVATGYETAALARDSVLRAAPRLTEPWDAASLHQLTRSLYRSDLELKISHADQRIAAGTRRLAEQVRRVEKLEATGDYESLLAQALLTEMARALRLMRTGRALLAERLEALT